MSIHGDVISAHERIRSRIRHTPIELSHGLSRIRSEPGTSPSRGRPAGAPRVWLKLECHQMTGSFKLRGAYNKLLSLSPAERARGVVAASTGNHGCAVAHAATELGVRAQIFVPENADPGKLERIREFGGTIEVVGEECGQSEVAAREHAEGSGRTYISPYNDREVMAGQGTIGLELDRELDSLDAVFVSVGGGGLAGGIAGYFAGSDREIEVIGASPANSPAMHAALEADRIVDVPHLPTLSDGTAGGMEPGAITFDVCREHLKEIVLVDEEETARAMRRVIGEHYLMIEGSAGVAVAAFEKVARRYAGKSVAIVLCGANISPRVLAEVLGGGD